MSLGESISQGTRCVPLEDGQALRWPPRGQVHIDVQDRAE
jgi:hypothetical protein